MKKIIITGNVGRDPEIRVDQSGNDFATFSVGVSVGTSQNPKTDWVDVSCNGKLADVTRSYVRKGTKILVEGFPTVNAYMSKDNKPVGTLRIYANNLELLSKKDGDKEPDNVNDETYSLPEHTTANVSSSTDDSNQIPF